MSCTVTPMCYSYNEMRNVLFRLRGWPVPRDIDDSASNVKHTELWHGQR